ncbi:MAG TPA: hypothetical protein VMA37_02385 [Acetobacteraceae bacterium]|nr:hypothetical protein [Acetobacteraceae bacterium]
MDVATIDQQYQQLQTQAQQTIQEIRELAGKLSDAAKAGNQDAREWLLDLKSIALALQAEQNQVGLLLQALHGFVANQGANQGAMMPAPAQNPTQGPWSGGPPMGAGYQSGFGTGPMGGGMLGGFLNSGFGRAVEMGLGFGLGDDLINKIF